VKNTDWHFNILVHLKRSSVSITGHISFCCEPPLTFAIPRLYHVFTQGAARFKYFVSPYLTPYSSESSRSLIPIPSIATLAKPIIAGFSTSQETERLVADPAPGITAEPHEDNLRYFNVTIKGPDGSPFQSTPALPMLLVITTYQQVSRWHIQTGTVFT
jgi:hypothetical protein